MQSIIYHEDASPSPISIHVAKTAKHFQTRKHSTRSRFASDLLTLQPRQPTSPQSLNLDNNTNHQPTSRYWDQPTLISPIVIGRQNHKNCDSLSPSPRLLNLRLRTTTTPFKQVTTPTPAKERAKTSSSPASLILFLGEDTTPH